MYQSTKKVYMLEMELQLVFNWDTCLFFYFLHVYGDLFLIGLLVSIFLLSIFIFLFFFSFSSIGMILFRDDSFLNELLPEEKTFFLSQSLIPPQTRESSERLLERYTVSSSNHSL